MILKESTTYNFSEQRVLECTSNSSCSGGYVEYALATVINSGLSTE